MPIVKKKDALNDDGSIKRGIIRKTNDSGRVWYFKSDFTKNQQKALRSIGLTEDCVKKKCHSKIQYKRQKTGKGETFHDARTTQKKHKFVDAKEPKKKKKKKHKFVDASEGEFTTTSEKPKMKSTRKVATRETFHDAVEQQDRFFDARKKQRQRKPRFVDALEKQERFYDARRKQPKSRFVDAREHQEDVFYDALESQFVNRRPVIRGNDVFYDALG